MSKSSLLDVATQRYFRTIKSQLEFDPEFTDVQWWGSLGARFLRVQLGSTASSPEPEDKAVLVGTLYGTLRDGSGLGAEIYISLEDIELDSHAVYSLIGTRIRNAARALNAAVEDPFDKYVREVKSGTNKLQGQAGICHKRLPE